MLVVASKELIAAPENTVPRFTLADRKKQSYDSVWFGHPLQIGGTLKDGTRVSLTLNDNETAELYLLLRNNEAIRKWAETIEYWKTKGSTLPDKPVLPAEDEHDQRRRVRQLQRGNRISVTDHNGIIYGTVANVDETGESFEINWDLDGRTNTLMYFDIDLLNFIK
jgi:hypothetical protein